MWLEMVGKRELTDHRKRTPDGPRMSPPPPHRCHLHDMRFPACDPEGKVWIGRCVGFELGVKGDDDCVVCVGKKE